MATTITVLSQKGGTGKTTTTRTLVDIFRRIGLRVLAVDMDPQGNLTDYFAVGDGVEPTLADVLAERAGAAESIHSDVLPASIHLAESELLLSGKIGREMVLRRALASVGDDYDLILIDCPPALGLLTVNALVAADHALISTEAEYFSLQGVEQALEVVEAARGLSPDLAWLGAVLNIADMRTVHAREALEQLRDGYGDKVFDTPIRRSVAYAESAERAVSIVDYRPDLGADYLSLADEVLARLGRDDDRKALRKLRAELAPAA
jgi:chromosome partitioning protein